MMVYPLIPIDPIEPIRDRVNSKVDELLTGLAQSKVTTVVGRAFASVRHINKLNAVWNSDSAGGAQLLRELAEYSVDVLGQVFNSKPTFQLLARRVRFLAAASVPFALFGMYSNGKNVVQGKNRGASGVHFARSLGWLCDSAGTVLSAVREVPGVSAAARVAIGQAMIPISAVAIAAATISFGWHCYAIHTNRKIHNNIGDFVNAADQDKLLDTFYLSDEKKKESAEQSIRDAAVENPQILKDRVKSIIAYHAMAMTALTISTVAVILLMFPPTAVAGTVLLAVGAVVSLGALVYDMHAQAKMEKALEIPQNKWKKYAFVAGVVSLLVVPALAVTGFGRANLA